MIEGFKHYSQSTIQPILPVSSTNFRRLLLSQNIPIQDRSSISEESDLGDKFEVAALFCAGLINSPRVCYPGFIPEAVVDLNYIRVKGSGRTATTTNEVLQEGHMFEVKHVHGELKGRSLKQIGNMIRYLAETHESTIQKFGLTPNISLVTTSDTVITNSIIQLASGSGIKINHFILTYEEKNGDVYFSSTVPNIVTSNQITFGTKGVGSRNSSMRKLSYVVSLSHMKFALTQTRNAP